MPIPRRRAWAGIGVQIARTLSAYKFVRRLARFALDKSRHRYRDAVGDPVHHSEAGAPFRVNQDEREAFRPRRRVPPLERRRDVLPDAIGVGLIIASILHRKLAVVLEAWRRQGEIICGKRRRTTTQAE